MTVSALRKSVFNGTAADKDRCMFTPRNDRCELTTHSMQRGSLHWPEDNSSWDMNCAMTYAIAAPNAIDITFEATPFAARFPLGYAAFMSASYMNRTRERRIHFIGRDAGREGARARPPRACWKVIQTADFLTFNGRAF